MNTKDVIIIGAGAAGLTAAICAAKEGKSVLILERMNQIGKKILATGNGKCNITNSYMDENCYRGTQKTFATQVIGSFDHVKTLSFFHSIGLYTKDKGGYIYPGSEQASSVVDALKEKIDSLRIPIKTDTKVIKIEKNNYGFYITTKEETYCGKYVILAAGGMANSKLGSDGSGYELARQLGHKIITPVPALTALKSDQAFFKQLAGIRINSHLRLFIDEKFIIGETGELQLTNYGVSGIPVFQISRYASRAFIEKKSVRLEIDFMPHVEEQTLYVNIHNFAKECPYKRLDTLLQGFFNKKLVPVLLLQAGLSTNSSVQSLNKNQLTTLTKVIKNYKVTLFGSNDFEQAQVTCGGIDTKEVDPNTMLSKKVPGLYLVGELLDVDGICGGYNLQWAWATGFIAGTHIKENK